MCYIQNQSNQCLFNMKCHNFYIKDVIFMLRTSNLQILAKTTLTILTYSQYYNTTFSKFWISNLPILRTVSDDMNLFLLWNNIYSTRWQQLYIIFQLSISNQKWIDNINTSFDKLVVKRQNCQQKNVSFPFRLVSWTLKLDISYQSFFFMLIKIKLHIKAQNLVLQTAGHPFPEWFMFPKCVIHHVWA